MSTTGDQPVPPPSGQNVGSTVSGWMVAILLLLVAVLVYQMATSGTGLSVLHDPAAQPHPIAARGDLASDEKSTIELFRNASPAVVHITTLSVGRDRVHLNLFEIPQGSGSGFIWDENGYVVTNFHVISGAQRARVTLADNSSWPARLVGAEPDKDLAVLKIDLPKARLRSLPIGSSSDLSVGQKVFAIGNPFSLDQTLTTGIISGLGREIQSVTKRPIQNVIQTDAAINPGNSGGPLLDSAGRLIGVNTAIYSTTGAYAGIGFAVPVDTVNRIVPQLIQKGKVDRPGLGVHIFEDAQVERLVAQNALPKSGVLIRDVLPGTGAAEAGIRPTTRSEEGQIELGDLIIAIDGKEIASSEDLFDVLASHQVGDTLRLTVLRDGDEVPLEVTLHALPSMEP